MIKLYVAKINWYSDYDDKEKYSNCIYGATSYIDAATKIVDDWGEQSIIGFELHCLTDEDENGSILISDTMYDAFLHDVPEDVYCISSEWRRAQEAKKYDSQSN